MQNHKGRDDFMAIKLDMSKAYDRVEWHYLESIMVKMGFSEHWIKLLMLCVKTVSYSILVNGEPKGMITHQEAFAKETLYLPSYFYFAQKVFMDS